MERDTLPLIRLNAFNDLTESLEEYRARNQKRQRLSGDAAIPPDVKKRIVYDASMTSEELDKISRTSSKHG